MSSISELSSSSTLSLVSTFTVSFISESESLGVDFGARVSVPIISVEGLAWAFSTEAEDDDEGDLRLRVPVLD